MTSVLDGLDRIDWSGLRHARGAGREVPDLLRALAGSDRDAAGVALDRIVAVLFPGGQVFPATVPAVPYLIELAMVGRHQRPRIVETLGTAADPGQGFGTPVESVRAAVVACADVLRRLLADPDPEVQAAAAYAVAQCGGTASVEALWERWATEDAPEAQASLLLALHLRDPAGCADLLPRAVLHGPYPVRAGAALALLRSGGELPAGARAALAEALAAGVEVRDVWRRDALTLRELVAYLDDPVRGVAVPMLVRVLGSEEAKDADDRLNELIGDCLEAGEVDEELVSAVPHLVQLALTGPRQRAKIVDLLGLSADRDLVAAGPVDRVRSALAAQAGGVRRLLSDSDPAVRAAAVYAAAQCGEAVPVEVLRDRWATEKVLEVRASLVLALYLRDPAGSGELVRQAVLAGPPPVRIAAALAILHGDGELPAGAAAALAEAIDAGAEIRYVWRRVAGRTEAEYAHDEPFDYVPDRGRGEDALVELLGHLDDPATIDLLAALLGLARPDTRRAAIRAIWQRSGWYSASDLRRSVLGRLAPLLGPSLADPDHRVQAEAVAALSRAGADARTHADTLARIAAGFPRTFGQTHSTEEKAINTLIGLGDPRWVDPLCAAWLAGYEQEVRELRDCRPDPAVLLAVRRRLAALAAAETSHPNTVRAVVGLVEILGRWGTAATAAEPELMTALPLAPREVTRALAVTGTTAADALPHLHAAALAGDADCGVRLWQLTGDPAPLVSGIERHLAAVAVTGLAVDGRPVSRAGAERIRSATAALTTAAAAGEALGTLVPNLRFCLTGRTLESWLFQELQVAAAHMVWLATGDAAEVLPTVKALLASENPLLRRGAAELAARLAEPSLAPPLREWLHDHRTSGQVPAARALWRLGEPVNALVPPLIAKIERNRSREAVSLLVEMGATAAAPELARLADVLAGGDEAAESEPLQQELHAAAAALSAKTSRGSSPG